ncbi:MAG: threonine--tRNA ligase, partial [Clostridia bacterium]|nr:threonine--tRNA ligase [Clostridia bacterium]
MFKITFEGHEPMTFDAPITVYEAAKGEGLTDRSSLAALVNGEVRALSWEISADAQVKILAFDDAEGKHVFWHSASHVLAQAVKRLYPAAKLTIGPAIETGFYYDIDSEVAFTPEILASIEAEMQKIVKENHLIERFTLSREEAIKLMTEKEEPYKVQLIEELPEGEEISFYKQGEFTDLCAGPHIFSTGAIKALKLIQCTGAYWKGDQNNKQLQRIYGIAFPAKDMLKAHLAQVEEAKKRDHNKLGRELELFTTVDTIGQGLPIMLPKGARLIQLLQRWIEDEEQKRGYLLTKTPLMAKSDLYKISGHWDHYKDGMFV